MKDLKKEFVESFRFALPIVLTQCGFLCFSIIDIYMVSRIDLLAIGGLGNANSLFWPIYMTFCGVVYAMDALVSQEAGAEKSSHLGRLLFHGLVLGGILSLGTLAVFLLIYFYFDLITTDSKLILYSKTYFLIIAFSSPLLIMFTVFQRYWQARGVTKSLLYIVVAANILNFIANEILIFGRFGFPALGITGAAISTTLSRLFMLSLVVLMTYRILSREQRAEYFNGGVDSKIIWKMILIGMPIGLMLFFEVSVFALATRFATRISAVATSVHHIGIVLISVFYTIPTGISSAAAYRVGYFLGKKEYQNAKTIGYIAIVSCAVVMGVISFLLYYNAVYILNFFTPKPEVITMGIPILLWIAISLVFDAVQCCVAGCLRGGARTQLSSLTTLICHYGIGLPLAYYFCFVQGKGVAGLWIGLAIGLITIAVVLLSYWCWLPANNLLPKKEE